jgi:myo-inositol 2-dehydrogenase/D-chiro-inositol 1-dehydrogenase
MKTNKEIRSRFFALNSRFDYLPDEDRFLFARGAPKYRFNLIGAGSNGQEHIRITQIEGRGTIHGIYDPNPRSIELAEQAFAEFSPQDSLFVYDTLEQACYDPEADGLIISTPNYTHIDVIRTAVKSGKHILLEKPMATTIPAAYEITKLARQYPAVFQIGLQYRHKAIYVEAIHEALERRSIGEVKTISILEHRIPFLDKVRQWNKFSKYSGGTLVEKCCHYFDLLNLFAGSRPATVYATGGMAVNFIDFEYASEKSDIIDHAFVTVTYENGVRASFNLCMFAPMFYEEIVVCGDEGHLKAYENDDFLGTSEPKTYLKVMQKEHRPSRITTPTYASFLEQSGHNGATFIAHINFVDNIEGKPTNTARVEDGLWSVVVGVAAEESIKSGKIVSIDELLQRNGVKIE